MKVEKFDSQNEGENEASPGRPPRIFVGKTLEKQQKTLYLSTTVFQSFLHESAKISVGREDVESERLLTLSATSVFDKIELILS